jgi:hypothetical protein
MRVSTLQKIAQDMRDSDIDQGHAGADVQWGRYEVLARVAVERMAKEGLIISDAVTHSVLEGKP